jgi:hypothetical protein
MARQVTKTGKELERRVADAYRAMGWRVKHDVELVGNQIDVYAELETAGRLLHRIAIEVKDWSKTAGIDVVNEFVTIVNLLHGERLIDEGVIVSSGGFSKQARNAAQIYGVLLLEPADLEAMVKEAKGGMPPQPSIISDKIDFYLVKEGNMHYIPDNPTLRYVEKSLGLRIYEYSSEKMRQLPFSLGDPLLSRAPGIVQDSQGIKYLVVVREEKRRILNDETLKALGGDPHTIFPTEDEYPASLQEGLSLPEEWGEQWFTSKPKLEEYVAAGYRSRFLVCGQICRYISEPEWVRKLRERLGIGSIEPIDRQKLESYVEGIPIDSERDVQTVLLQLCAKGSGGALV